MKRFATLLLALIMILSLATTAFADEGDATINNSITITGAKVGETYNLYKLFDLKVDDESNPTAYSYTITEGWKAFFAPASDDTEAGPGNKYITVNEAGYVTDIPDAAALAKAAAAWTDKPNATDTVIVQKGESTAVFANLKNGYWLITSTLGTFAMTETTPDKKQVTINEKNPEDTITKEVKEDSTKEYGKNNDAQVGDTVEFKSTITLNKGTRNVVVHDAMDSGLTLNQDSISIAGLTNDTDYTVAFNTTDGCDFEITFKQEYLDKLTEPTVLTLTYTAVLNEGAVVMDENGVAIVDQYNKTTVSFGDNQTSQEANTITTTHKVIVHKYAEGVEHLAGAEFSLKKGSEVVKLIKLDDLNYRVAKSGESGAVETFTTVATGDIVIWGLDTDTDYTLEEITAPSGYNKLTAKVEVTVKADDSTEIDVENKAGTELPSTGGMGTTLFYMIGGVMVLASVVLLVTKKRMSVA